MHSHDRTLLARLGFSDPDKKEPLHDLACAYLAEDAQARKLVSMIDPGAPPAPTGWHEHGTSSWRTRTDCSVELARSMPNGQARIIDRMRLENPRPTLEKPLTKGSGQYATTIGFLDLVIEYMWQGHDVGWTYSEGQRAPSDQWVYVRGGSILAEVKITRVPLGDVLRQLKLYAQHPGDPHDTPALVLATAYPISRDDVAVLAREKIRHVRLGDGFKTWCERPREDDESPCL